MITILMDGPAVPIERHMCETCIHSQRIRHSNSERQFCHMGRKPIEISSRVQECSSHRAMDDEDQMRAHNPKAFKDVSWSRIVFRGKFYFVPPNEADSWEYMSSGSQELFIRKLLKERKRAGYIDEFPEEDD